MRFGAMSLTLLLTLSACTATRPDLAGMSFSEEPLVGKFVWHDLVTEDIDAARRFYGALFGWTFEPAPRRDGRAYALARSGGVYVAGLVAADPRPDGRNVSRWLPYASVADVDLAVERGRTAGAAVPVPPRDVPLGRVAVIVDREGAVIGLARSAIGDPDERTTRPAPGRTLFTELLADEAPTAAAFYAELVGYAVETVDRRGGTYRFLTTDGRRRAGVLQNPTEDWDPLWLTHFAVADPVAAATEAERLGGRVLLPASPDLREGTMTVVADPTGAVLVLTRWPQRGDRP
jgi:hypothetical protein